MLELLSFATFFGGGYYLLHYYGWLAALIGVGVSHSLIEMAQKAVKGSRAKNALVEMARHARNGNLARRFQPEIGLEVEACAREALAVRQLLEGVGWSSRTGPWADVRRSAGEAVSGTMADVFKVASPGFRLEGGRRLFRAHAENADQVAQTIASLQTLRGHLTKLRSELEETPSAAGNQLEDTLGRIRELKQAEQELNQYLQLGEDSAPG
jgi:hypothetical protein